MGKEKSPHIVSQSPVGTEVTLFTDYVVHEGKAFYTTYHWNRLKTWHLGGWEVHNNNDFDPAATNADPAFGLWQTYILSEQGDVARIHAAATRQLRGDALRAYTGLFWAKVHSKNPNFLYDGAVELSCRSKAINLNNPAAPQHNYVNGYGKSYTVGTPYIDSAGIYGLMYNMLWQNPGDYNLLSPSFFAPSPGGLSLVKRNPGQVDDKGNPPEMFADLSWPGRPPGTTPAHVETYDVFAVFPPLFISESSPKAAAQFAGKDLMMSFMNAMADVQIPHEVTTTGMVRETVTSPQMFFDFVTTLPRPFGELDGTPDMNSAHVKIDSAFQTFSLPGGDSPGGLFDEISSYNRVKASLPGPTEATTGAESALPNYAAYLTYKDLPTSFGGDFDPDPLPLTVYRKYLKAALTLNFHDVFFTILADPSIAPGGAGLQKMLDAIDKGEIDEYYDLFLERFKLMNSDPSNGDDVAKPYQQLLDHTHASQHVVIMQSVLKLLQENYKENDFPSMLKYYTNLPFITEQLWYQGDETKLGSLLEALDHYDLDYFVLKAIVENTVEKIFPMNKQLHFSQGITVPVSESLADAMTYVNNPCGNRQLFSHNDNARAVPNLNMGPGQMFTSNAMRGVSSFIFHSIPIKRASSQTNGFIYAIAAPFDNVSWDMFTNGLNACFDRSFTDLVQGYFEPWDSGEDAKPFQFLGGQWANKDHLYLDSLAKEINEYEDPMIKFNVAADKVDYTSGTGAPKYANLWDKFHTEAGAEGYTSFKEILRGGGMYAATNYIGFSKGPTRDFEEIIRGKKAHSEILYFRIAKYDEDGKFVQNIFVPNAPEFNPKYFIDTQLLPDKRYSYVIYAWLAIHGTSYMYNMHPGMTEEVNQYYLESHDSDGTVTNPNYGLDDFAQRPQAQDLDFSKTWYEPDVDNTLPGRICRLPIHVSTAPCIKCIEIPYYKIGPRGVVRLLTPHPVKPNVEIAPYEGKNDTLLFLLSSRYGATHRDFLIGINPEDDDQVMLAIEKMIEDGVTSFSDLDLQLDFNTAAGIDRFEIYRLDKKPSSYSDFTNGTRVDLKPFSGVRKEHGPPYPPPPPKRFTISSVSYEDETITPNKKYYYTFRVVDKNGKWSNPTPVYEIEIVDDKGTIYPVIDIVDFDIENNKQAVKNMRKYMYIAPVLEQTELNLDTADYENQTAGEFLKLHPDQPHLGVSDIDAFRWKYLDGKLISTDTNPATFKIRLTSKKTGRKADINLVFKSDHITTQEQTESE